MMRKRIQKNSENYASEEFPVLVIASTWFFHLICFSEKSVDGYRVCTLPKAMAFHFAIRAGEGGIRSRACSLTEIPI